MHNNILNPVWDSDGELPNTSYKYSCYINLFKYSVKTGVMP